MQIQDNGRRRVTFTGLGADYNLKPEELRIIESQEGGAEVLDPTMSVEQALKSEDQAAVQDALLREMARKIEWKVGQVIDIDTEDGYEKGATILGPSTEGDKTQMSVRFADGSVDNWDKEDFVALATELSVPDDKATGKAAAIALQQEIVKHGTADKQKIQRLRRASMQPDDAATQAMEAAAMAAAVADIAEDDEESDGEDTLALDITVQEALQHESKEAVQEALLREAARMIKWQVGQVIDIDTDGGLEEAVIVGPSKSGAAEQMSVRFADGSVSDWDVEDYVARVISAVSSPVVLQQEVVQNGTSNP
jgi:hypothetical protein